MVFFSRDTERGDTIVEVMFAIAVFAFIAASSLAIMRQGIATSMRSLEITQARQTMNDQAELLRFVQQEAMSNSGDQAYKSLWTKLSTKNATPGYYGNESATALGSCNPTSANHPFALNPDKMQSGEVSSSIMTPVFNSTIAPAYPQVVTTTTPSITSTAYDFWIESVPGVSAGQKFVDFHIRACWDAPGSSAPVTLGTIVRLYDN